MLSFPVTSDRPLPGQTIAALKTFLFRCARHANKGALAAFVSEFQPRREEARAAMLDNWPLFAGTSPLSQNGIVADMPPVASPSTCF